MEVKLKLSEACDWGAEVFFNVGQYQPKRHRISYSFILCSRSLPRSILNKPNENLSSVQDTYTILISMHMLTVQSKVSKSLPVTLLFSVLEFVIPSTFLDRGVLEHVEHVSCSWFCRKEFFALCCIRTSS